MTNTLLSAVGDYALIVLFFLLLFSAMNKGGYFNTRLAFLLAVLFVVSLVGSKNWPTLKSLYIYFFAFIALIGKLMGTIEIFSRTGDKIRRVQPAILQLVFVFVFSVVFLVIEFADTFIAPFLQSNLPASWWRAGSWMLPALGIASALGSSARKAIYTLFPGRNSRLILFFFVLAAGLLVPLTFPAIDQVFRWTTILGVLVGLISLIRGKRTVS